MEIFASIFDSYQTFITQNSWIAILATFLLPFIEAILPTLPLGAIVAVNLAALSTAYGSHLGTFLTVVLSVSGSFLGMFMIFLIIRKTLAEKFALKVESNEIGRKFLNIAQKSNLSLMMVFLANPFMPSSILNYALSFTKIKASTYIWMNVISRLIIVVFLVFLGSLFDIQNNPINVLWISLAYAFIFILMYFLKLIRKNNHY
jgi:uncharacterized membrane protein YdjX (TVP38/TMEM64 family)